MNKRNDLQWLRALAIFAVFTFHLKPKKFPYGYLGVDIFFVISGYLMTVILSQNPNLSKFYLNRIKRIFPSYLLIILCLFVSSYFLLLSTDYKYFKIEVIWSIFFSNNLYPMFYKKQYFKLMADYKFLLHFWSLGCEIQYYLIAPFLIKFILSRSKPLYWIFFIGFCSFFSQIFIPIESVTFGLVFCRIWQFLVGSFAFCFTNESNEKYELLNSDETSDEPSDEPSDDIPETLPFSLTIYCSTILIFISLVGFCFLPKPMETYKYVKIGFRFCSTVFTGAFITLNSVQSFKLWHFIDSILVFIGDSSYIIYLVHWPIIVYFRYYSINYGIILPILIIIFISLFLYKCFEIPMRKQSTEFNLSFIIIFYAIILPLCFINIEKPPPFPNIIEQNEAEAKTCERLYFNDCESSPIVDKYLTIRPKSEDLEKYCSYKLNPNATKTIMITGNSYVYFQNRGILEAIKASKTQFREAYFLTHPVCSILAGKLNYNHAMTCENIDGSFDALLNATKPDIIIHSSRLDHFLIYYSFSNPNDVTDLYKFSDTDYIYSEFKRSILNIAKYTPRLIIIQPNPTWSPNYTSQVTIARALKTHQSILQYNTSIERYYEYQNPTWNRIKKAVESCPNCIILPTQKLFCEEKFCSIVDPKTQLAMYCDYSHLSPKYSLCLKPNLIEAIDKEVPVMTETKCDLALVLKS